jgi:hypothetical protein
MIIKNSESFKLIRVNHAAGSILPSRSAPVNL